MKPDIKKRRLELGMTLEEVGNLVGVGKSTVRKWETGDIANMKRDKIVKLADALKVSPSFIMGFEDEKETHSTSFSEVLAAHIDDDVTDEEKEDILAYVKMRMELRKKRK